MIDCLVCKTGFMASVVAALVGGAEHEVVLRRGSDLVVTCKNMDGEPLAGVSIRLSKSPLPYDSSRSWSAKAVASGVAESSDPATAIHQQRTGFDGSVSFSHLADGPYQFDARHPTKVVAKGIDGVLVEIPSERIDLTFTDVWALAVRPVGDRLVGHSMALEPDSVGLVRPLRNSFHEIQETLHSLCSGGTYVAYSASPAAAGGSKGRAPRARFDLYFQHKGMVSVSLALRTLDDPVQQLDVSAHADSRLMGEVAVSLVDPSGTRMPIRDAALVERDARHRICRAFDLIDGVAWAPEGTYELYARDERLKGAVPPTRVQVIGQTHTECTVRLSSPMVPVRFEIEPEDRMAIDFVKVEVTYPASRKTLEVAMLVGRNCRETWLPPGDVEVRCTVHGYKTGVASASLVPGSLPTPLKMFLALED